MDNRLGSYVALEVARRCHERGGHAGGVAGVAAVQEEIGLNGARTSAFMLQPEIAVVVDVTHATDAPGVDEKQTRLARARLRAGDRPRRDPLAEGLRAARRDRGARGHRPHDRGLGPLDRRPTPTPIQISRAGIPTGLVSIPLRYMHSPVELVDLRDVEAAIELLVAFATSIDGRRRPVAARAAARTACRWRPARPRRARAPRSHRGRRRA